MSKSQEAEAAFFLDELRQSGIYDTPTGPLLSFLHLTTADAVRAWLRDIAENYSVGGPLPTEVNVPKRLFNNLDALGLKPILAKARERGLYIRFEHFDWLPGNVYVMPRVREATILDNGPIQLDHMKWASELTEGLRAKINSGATIYIPGKPTQADPVVRSIEYCMFVLELDILGASLRKIAQWREYIIPIGLLEEFIAHQGTSAHAADAKARGLEIGIHFSDVGDGNVKVFLAVGPSGTLRTVHT